jgi:hypothetical protein
MLPADRERVVRAIIRVVGINLSMYLAAPALCSGALPRNDHPAIA